MSKLPIRIVIVDDHALLAELLGTWIVRYPDLALAGRAGDGEAGWNLCQELRPDLALVDVDMPKLDGLALVNRLMEQMPAMRLITMTGRMDPFTIWRVSQSGVHGYLEKTLPPETLIEAVRAVAGGGTYYSPVFQKVKQEWLSQPEAFQKILSDREQEVLRRVVAGWNDERIAGQMGIAASTVGVHRKHIRGKLELHNDRDLVAYARKWGLDAAIPTNTAAAANPPRTK
ncbi:MAG TPA: response regulator transcription factor [Candidatus Sulfotelmatobacter sp.]|nr:response regulator transcription factor [Candidatus Sulfotelmatobacter sp.]